MLILVVPTLSASDPEDLSALAFSECMLRRLHGLCEQLGLPP